MFLTYLEYFRAVVVEKLTGLSDEELHASRLPSGWAPLGLLKHLIYVERRWLLWGFEGHPMPDVWGDSRDDRWYVAPEETLSSLSDELGEQAERTRAVVEAHALSDIGQPGERWDGADPATLERVLFHVLQEYARHAGHLDIVRELLDGTTGE